MDIPQEYELLDLLREGPNSTVWRARKLSNGVLVALKVLSPVIAGDEMEANEIRTLSLLPNRHIARLLDHGPLSRGRMFIVTELMTHGTLGDRLRREVLEPKEILRIASQVARGLMAAHASQVLHLDIKPSNIGITGSETQSAKLLDFGAAARGRRQVLAGVAQGTPIYCSPEQARGNHARPSSDVYSLGCVIYEMTEGRPPFVRGSIDGYLFAHMSEVPLQMQTSLFGQYQVEVENLVGTMLQKQPALRPTIVQVVETLTAIRENRVPPQYRNGPTVWDDLTVRVRFQPEELARKWASRW